MRITTGSASGQGGSIGPAARLDVALAAFLVGLAIVVWWSGERHERRVLARLGDTSATGAQEQLLVLLVLIPAALTLLLAARAGSLGRNMEYFASA